MVTFDFNQVRHFAAQLNKRLDECETGEGMQCDGIDATLTFCAQQCCEFLEGLRKWGQDIFSGRVAFDPAAEQLWKAESSNLFSRSLKLWELGKQAESVCYTLDGQKRLESALWNLQQLWSPWVTPRLAVGPSARQHIFSEDVPDAIRERLLDLPTLPTGWIPSNPQQLRSLQQIRAKKSANR